MLAERFAGTNVYKLAIRAAPPNSAPIPMAPVLAGAQAAPELLEDDPPAPPVAAAEVAMALVGVGTPLV